MSEQVQQSQQQTQQQSQAPMTERELGLIESTQARSELYDTLGQLRVQLDYAQRIDDGLSRAKHRIIAEKRDNPLAFAAAVAGVSAVCGVAVWAIASKVVKLFN
jgi:hypothetical protein